VSLNSGKLPLLEDEELVEEVLWRTYSAAPFNDQTCGHLKDFFLDQKARVFVPNNYLKLH
jgi:hypothetical protein